MFQGPTQSGAFPPGKSSSPTGLEEGPVLLLGHFPWKPSDLEEAGPRDVYYRGLELLLEGWPERCVQPNGLVWVIEKLGGSAPSVTHNRIHGRMHEPGRALECTPVRREFRKSAEILEPVLRVEQEKRNPSMSVELPGTSVCKEDGIGQAGSSGAGMQLQLSVRTGHPKGPYGMLGTTWREPAEQQIPIKARTFIDYEVPRREELRKDRNAQEMLEIITFTGVDAPHRSGGIREIAPGVPRPRYVHLRRRGLEYLDGPEYLGRNSAQHTPGGAAPGGHVSRPRRKNDRRRRQP